MRPAPRWTSPRPTTGRRRARPSSSWTTRSALRAVTERIFARNGYHVLTAASGADALALVARHEGQIHLLVTDVVMPKMLERSRRPGPGAPPDIEVLFMSGYAQPVLAAQGRLEPGVALVDKPFSEADLLAKAGQVLTATSAG